MSGATATVELLTAEVRVLQVGSRQVTQSVAKQLDRVPLTTLEIFGRIRLGEDRLVIGRAADGTLAVSAYSEHYREPLLVAFLEDLAEPLTLCHFFIWRNGGGRAHAPADAADDDVRVMVDSQLVWLASGAYTDAGCEHYSRDEQCVQQVSDENMQRLHELVIAHHERVAVERAANGAAACAPLIVLAGLR